jgi:hypothetical protein
MREGSKRMAERKDERKRKGKGKCFNEKREKTEQQN